MLYEEFQAICAAWEANLNALTDHANEQVMINIRASLQKTQKRLGLVSNIAPETTPTQDPVARPTFHLHRHGPGSCSPNGPRHDNDSEDIGKIAIMPTALELQSHRQEYLPVEDQTQFHIPGIAGLLDRQFRLLREDTVGQLRDVVRNLQDARNLSGDLHAARIFTYQHAKLRSLALHKHKGLELTYDFHQAHTGGRKSRQARQLWWEASKRLQVGSLVCVLNQAKVPLFCSVTTAGQWVNKQTEDPFSQWSNNESEHGTNTAACVCLAIVKTDSTTAASILDGFIPGRRRDTETLVEFPGVLLQSFQPTLLAMQRMSAKIEDVPFADLITHGHTRNDSPMEAPQYAARPGFRFDLSTLLTEDGSLWYRPGQPFDLKDLETRTTLDSAQAASLIAALSRRLALIQGPPGTGKSFTGVKIIKALLTNRKAAKLGPIICVCYTNHALDQLLENLVADGVQQIIRVGTRSKSELLQELTLTNVAQKEGQTRNEKHQYYQSKTRRDRLLKGTGNLLQRFEQAETAASIKNHLMWENMQFYNAIFQESEDVDEDGFHLVRHGVKDPLGSWLSGGERHDMPAGARSIGDLSSARPHDMHHGERVKIYRHWVRQIRHHLKGEIERNIDEYVEVLKSLDNLRQEVELRCLRQAHIIGATTTGLAQIMDLLERVQAKVLVCEEAGEVLEAHTLATFLPTIEHAILIGDHLQLRPQTQNYSFQVENPRGKQYSFDVSLFERLVAPLSKNEEPLPFCTLETQRRMHPSISQLIRSTLYPRLSDDPCVAVYPPVAGMRRRLFWFDHDHAEASGDRHDILSTSHENAFEATMAAALVSHLVRQGVYTQEDIAVLTPYLGQLRRLRSTLGSMFAVQISDRDVAALEATGDGLDDNETSSQHVSKRDLLSALRISTIDNFQGEEAKVVIISLVRCNEQNKCGFLRTSNRINVLLSRAKHGMYIIGNARTSSHVGMWAEVLMQLRQNNNFGQAFELACPRHPETHIEVKEPDHFATRSPEGGCQLKCIKRLNCGHACIQRCHSDVLHAAVRCLESCPRPLKGCTIHPCPKVCGDACPMKCLVKIPDVLLPCGHRQTLRCWQAQDLAQAPCQTVIQHTVDGCQHVIKIKCHQAKNPDTIGCSAVCSASLNCGHNCKRTCYTCRKVSVEGPVAIDHGKCQQPCGRPYTTCGHNCTTPCHGSEPCRLCQAPCENRCSHSACSKKCNEPCKPCSEERCASQCPHQRCDMPCAVPCNWIPCSERCSLLLKCGHRCPSLCGETCPNEKYCQICGNEEVRGTIVDYIMGELYSDVNLDEDPCIFPACGHFLTRSNMDSVFDLANHYTLTSNGNISSIGESTEHFSSKDLKACPKCRGTLCDIRRYARIVKRAILDESTKRFTTWAHAEHASKAEGLAKAERDLISITGPEPASFGLTLQGSRQKQMQDCCGIEGFRSKYGILIKVYNGILEYFKLVRKEEQPYQHMKNLVENVQRRTNLNVANVPEVQTPLMGFELYATSMLLRLELAFLGTAITLKREGRASYPLDAQDNATDFIVDLSINRQDCIELFKMANDANYPAQEVEGHVLFARYAALEQSVAGISQSTRASTAHNTDGKVQRLPDSATLQAEGLSHTELARSICAAHPGTTKGLLKDVESAEKMLRDTFYETVTNEERRDVLRAMAREFRGTGHW